MKNFILNWRDAESKDDRMYAISRFFAEASKNMDNKKYKDSLPKMYDILASKKFVKAFNKCVKKDIYPLEKISVMGIMDYIENYNGESFDKSLLVEGCKNLLKSDIEAIRKRVDMPESIIFILMATYPEKGMLDGNILNRYVNKGLKRMYSYSNNMDIETITKIVPSDIKTTLKAIYGKKNIERILLTIALEGAGVDHYNDSGKLMYSKVTDMLLNELEDLPEKELRDFFEAYIEYRKNSYKDFKRRVDFTLIDENKYPRLAKVVSELKDNTAVK